METQYSTILAAALALEFSREWHQQGQSGKGQIRWKKQSLPLPSSKRRSLHMGRVTIEGNSSADLTDCFLDFLSTGVSIIPQHSIT